MARAGGGQGRLEMINPGRLPCQAYTSPMSAAQLTLPEPAGPSGLSRAGPGPDNVLESQLRRLLQEVFQDDTAGRGLDPHSPSFRSLPGHRAGHCHL